jgi:molybdopterin synthase catalytic subunit
MIMRTPERANQRATARATERDAEPPGDGHEWLALTAGPLPVASALDWVVRPECGAVALFCGTARDHAGDRSGVEELVYEAYEEQVVPRLEAVAAEMRARWPQVGRIALLHRTGALDIGDTAVVVAVSTPHRSEAFDAARFGIDALKASVPIWKKEKWSGGEAWGLEGTDLRPAAEVVP